DHDSRSEGSDQEKDSGDDKAQSDSENESDSEHETDKNEPGSESDQEDDEEEEEDKFAKTPSNDTDDEDEIKIKDKAEGDKDKEMDYTTSQLYDDMDIRLNKLVDTDKGFIQEEGTNAELTNVQQGNENPKIPQVIEDTHVTLSIVPHKIEVPVTSFSHSSDLAANFLNFADIPTTEGEIVSPMDIHVHHVLEKKIEKNAADNLELVNLIRELVSLIDLVTASPKDVIEGDKVYTQPKSDQVKETELVDWFSF
ncbi:hypothetical protein Tco_1373248, partial [Tanacetum coccineum]